MAIRLFITGGTFDKTYDEISGRLHFEDTHVHEMLQLGRCRLDARGAHPDDGGQPGDDRRRPPARSCENCRARGRGADRRHPRHRHHDRDRARARRGARCRRRSSSPGAMVPYAFGSSDGLFNLGSALSFVQALPHGVYVAMNGRCFPWDDVVKNRELGVFENRR